MNYQLLNRCPLFRGIPELENKKMFEQVHFQIKSFHKNEIIAEAGEQVKVFLIVISGSVRGEMIDYSGKTVKIEDIEAPKPLAAAFIFGKENKYPVTVTSNNDVKILAIPISDFLKLLQLNGQLLKNYLHSISTRAQFLSQKLYFLSFNIINNRPDCFFMLSSQMKTTYYKINIGGNILFRILNYPYYARMGTPRKN